LLVREYDQLPACWSSDGRLLAFREIHPKTGDDIWVLPLGEQPVEVLATEASERSAMFSPDGRWLAYVSDESGRNQVYVRSYPGGGEVYPISRDGGVEPLWSRDGRELFFRKGDALLSVTITANPELEATIPIVLFEKSFDWGVSETSYDVSPDGRRFLTVGDRSTTEFRVVLNWFEELNRLVPTSED